MAPNRRHHSTHTIETTPTFDLQIKFPPLTDEINNAPSQKKQFGGTFIIRAPHTKDSSHPSNNYWDWPEEKQQTEEVKKQELIEQILEEEEARLILSVEHLEEKLMSANKETKETIVSQTTNDDYWFESNDVVTKSVPAVPQHKQSYWDWQTLSPSEKKQRLIDTILQEEFCRTLLSVEHIEEAIIRQSASKSDTSTPKRSAKNDLYWDWTVPQDSGYWQWPSTSEDLNALAIQQILLEDHAMETCSIGHIESTLRNESNQVHEQQPPILLAPGGGDSAYWAW